MKSRASVLIPIPVVVIAVAALSACAGGAPRDPAADAPAASVPELLVELASPAGPGSRTPSLYAAADGTVYMSWLEPTGDVSSEAASTSTGRFALRFATLSGDTWSPAHTIAEGDDFFVNWADFPTIVESDGVLAAHWLRRNGGRGTAYDIHIARSTDGGESWSGPIVPHSDGTATEHGFVSLVPEPGGGFTAVWLDGRKFAGADDEAGREMTLRGARFDGTGKQLDEVLLDERICDCCQTSATRVGDTLVAVYRDRSEGEVRDMWSVRRTADGWQEPVPVAPDGWQIPGCPVNGPAIAANGDLAAVAWFTMPTGDPQVKVAFSTDAGVTYSTPIVLDSGAADGVDSSSPRQVAGLADASASTRPVPLGRVDVAWVDGATAAVSWIVARGADADIVLRTVSVEGRLGEPHVIASTGSMRASGFPRMVSQGDRLLIAWTVPDDDSSLRTGVIRLPLR